MFSFYGLSYILYRTPLSDPTDRARMLNDILPQSVAVDKIVAAAKKAKRSLTEAEQGQVDAVNKVCACMYV
jgi:hypothetical protein